MFNTFQYYIFIFCSGEKYLNMSWSIFLQRVTTLLPKEGPKAGLSEVIGQRGHHKTVLSQPPTAEKGEYHGVVSIYSLSWLTLHWDMIRLQS
jgi:hypothetical protein